MISAIVPLLLTAFAASAAAEGPDRLEASPTRIRLIGSDASAQIVTTRLQNGDARADDVTARASYSIDHPSVAQVGPDGVIRPGGDGRAVVTARFGDRSATVEVSVDDFANRRPVRFVGEVEPILTKNGCNSGGCHGKASGQNGFKLSLLGFDPRMDYEALAREGKGRRVFPAAPESSLLIAKATARLPHGGGKRLEPDSADYRTLARWIAQGMPFQPSSEPKLQALDIEPAHRVVPQRGGQRLRVVARYDDGSIEDVTKRSQYQTNAPDLASVDGDGAISTLSAVGEAAVMARFNGQVAAARVTVPSDRPARDWQAPKSDNPIDRHVFGKLRELGLRPSDVCSDPEFIRRVSLDTRGVLPTVAEVRRFLSDPDPDKRAKLALRFVDSPEYADHFAMKWSTILRNQRTNGDQSLEGSFIFHSWIRHAIASNLPYDQFAASILSASGGYRSNPPVVWYRQVRSNQERADDSAQLFLGLRIQCARCHHHPFERWSQDDYFGYASFFSRIRVKNNDFVDPVIANARSGMEFNPSTNRSIPPTLLGGKALENLGPTDDPRKALADWLRSKDNPFLAPAVINRYWKHFFGRGLVEPEDDFRSTNPPSNPALLQALTRDFIDHGYDLKRLTLLMVTSRTYERSSLPNPDNAADQRNFARYYPKRLSAEAMLDAISAATGTAENFANVPKATRAVQLPDDGFASAFLDSFGRPKRESVCECERIQEANLSQTLQMINSGEIQGKVAASEGRASTLAKDPRPDAAKIGELYWLCFARDPSADELAVCLDYLRTRADAKKPAQAYEDLIWALINTKEFLFIH